MQFVSDDMDDELFRRAAEEYPLNTDKGDWNKMLDKMKAAGVHAPQKKNRKRNLLFLALIPLLLICTTYIKSDIAVNNAELTKKNPTITSQASRNSAVSKPNKNEPSLDRTTKPNALTNDKEEQLKNSKNEEATTVQQRDIATTSVIDKTVYRNGSKRNSAGSAENIDRNLLTKTKDISSSTSSDSKVNSDAIETRTPKQGVVTGEPNVAADNSITEKLPETLKEDPKNTSPATAVSKPKKEKRKEAKFYLGFQAGPDFSMVKSADINGVGYSLGLITGYNISRTFAVETGLLWDRKKYESSGQYFKTDKLDWPHVTILSLSGYCDMFEIPLNVRYNISTNSKRTWFANAGLSSYLMKKENYDYHYQRYGVYGYGNKEYENTTNDWLSVAHLSIALQKNIGSIGNLRIEPYVKLPLNGVGIGSMPLSSTGIYLGITRPIR